jgi:hypothetical protein
MAIFAVDKTRPISPPLPVEDVSSVVDGAGLRRAG